MSTKLDDLVGHLAGREGDPRFLEQLADPSSDASLFLEAARTRSKALIQEPLVKDSRRQPVLFRSGLGPIAWVCLASTLVVLALTLGLIAWQLRRIDANDREAESEARTSNARLESTLDRILESHPEPVSLEPVSTALNRVEASLRKLENRLDRLETQPDSRPADPIVTQIREELAILRRDFTATEKGKTRQMEELQTSTHEDSRVLRLLLNRLEPPAAPVPDPPRTFKN